MNIVHLSDLHFGCEDKKVIKPLLLDIEQQHPKLVVISGDLTQRAKPNQFKSAKKFIDSLNVHKVIVPGNHDISLYNPFQRFLIPMHRFSNLIHDQEFSTYIDSEVAVIGVNTARPYLWKEGRVSIRQLNYIKREFNQLPENVVKVVVTHHPLFAYKSSKGSIINSKDMIKTFRECSVDLLLAGHLHLSFSSIYHFEEPVQTLKRGLFILAQASTSISRRIREKFNAYNIISIDWPFITIQVRRFDGAIFQDHERFIYEKVEGHWHPRPT